MFNYQKFISSSILDIKSSLFGTNSTTNALVDAIHHRFKSLSTQHVTRDLLPENTTHLALGKSQASIDVQLVELQAADVLVLGAPMYNFGISSTLKAWIDHVVRARRNEWVNWKNQLSQMPQNNPSVVFAQKRANEVSARMSERGEPGFKLRGPNDKIDSLLQKITAAQISTKE